MLEIDQLLNTLKQLLLKKKMMLVTAESCTGGWIAQVITSMAGSSKWYERGFVTYSNQAKMDLLGVAESTLIDHGAVSEETAKEMVVGALNNSPADVAISVTGIAGPGGGSLDKPVGLVWFGFASKAFGVHAIRQQFSGDRAIVREQAVRFSLQQLIDYLQR